MSLEIHKNLVDACSVVDPISNSSSFLWKVQIVHCQYYFHLKRDVYPICIYNIY